MGAPEVSIFSKSSFTFRWLFGLDRTRRYIVRLYQQGCLVGHRRQRHSRYNTSSSWGTRVAIRYVGKPWMNRYDDARHRPILIPPAASIDVQISHPGLSILVSHARSGTQGQQLSQPKHRDCKLQGFKLERLDVTCHCIPILGGGHGRFMR